jgi:hypothetical protein
VVAVSPAESAIWSSSVVISFFLLVLIDATHHNALRQLCQGAVVRPVEVVRRLMSSVARGPKTS